MRFSLFQFSCQILLTLVLGWGVFCWSQPAQAVSIDPYVLRYLDAKEPVALPFDAQDTKDFSPQQLSEGKRFFEENCKNCHVGGTTLPDPTVSLSLQALQAAMPPRDTVKSLATFLRQPMTYDGSEESLYCRVVPESWLPQMQLENLAAFILRSAQKAPGWGDFSF